MFSTEVKEAAQCIGHFYLKKNHNDYVRTEKELRELQISKIEVSYKNITITSNRIDLIIGKRAENINALSLYMQTRIHLIEEDNIYDHLIPLNFDNED